MDPVSPSTPFYHAQDCQPVKGASLHLKIGFLWWWKCQLGSSTIFSGWGFSLHPTLRLRNSALHKVLLQIMLFPSSKLASYHIYFLTIQLPFPLAYFQGSLVRTTPEAQIQTFCLAKKSTATPISVTIPTHRSFAIKSTRGNFLTSPMSSTGEIWSSQVRL